jgi:hypothetical protein
MQPQKVGASMTKKSNLRLDQKMSKFGIITRPITFDFSIFRFSIHVWMPPYSFNVAMHRLKGNKVAQAKFLQAWSKKAYSYTAKVKQYFDKLNIDKEDSPCAEQFSDVADVSVDG